MQNRLKAKYNFKEFLQLVLAFVMVLIIYSMIGCPIRLLTGISCPGCGMTRAWVNVLSGNFDKAFYYHPMWLLPLLFIPVWLFIRPRYRKIYHLAVIFGSLLLLITYVIRLYTHHPILVVDPQNSLVVRIVRKLIQ